MRVIARLLDYVIVSMVIGFGIAAFVLSGGDDAGFAGVGTDASFSRLYLLGVFGVVVGFVWDAVFTKQFGGSPMKLAFGMRVVRADTGGDVEWSHAIKRWAVAGALALIPIPLLPGLARLVIGIVSLVYLFSKPLRQTVADLVAATIVVSTR